MQPGNGNVLYGVGERVSSNDLPFPNFYLSTSQENAGQKHNHTYRLPPLEGSVITRIRGQEFVNFEQLLPQGSLNQSSFSIEVSESGNPTLVSRPARGKGKISDFHSWLSAWNVYISVLSHYCPQLTSQLLGYQAIITRFSSLYSFEAWSTYDRLFRLLVSNNSCWFLTTEGQFGGTRSMITCLCYI